MVIMVSTWHLFHSIRSKALVNRKFERHRTMKCGYLPLDRADCYGANSGPSERFWNYLRQVNVIRDKTLHCTLGIFFFQTNFFIVRKPCFQKSALPASCLWNRWTLQCTEGFEWFAPLYHEKETGRVLFWSMIFWLGSRKSYFFCKSIGSPYVPPALDLLLQQLLHQVEEP